MKRRNFLKGTVITGAAGAVALSKMPDTLDSNTRASDPLASEENSAISATYPAVTSNSEQPAAISDDLILLGLARGVVIEGGRV